MWLLQNRQVSGHGWRLSGSNFFQLGIRLEYSAFLAVKSMALAKGMSCEQCDAQHSELIISFLVVRSTSDWKDGVKLGRKIAFFLSV